MKTEILIVTYAKDFPYLEWCLKSVSKFARGFERINILIPTGNRDLMTVLLYGVAQTHPLPFPILIQTYDEWPGKGMLHHDFQIMNADKWCSSADFIAHIDADCIFTASVTPDTYIVNGKPLLRFEPFARLGNRHAGVMCWKPCTERCLPFPIEHETMRCHPEVYHRRLYAVARDLIAYKLGHSLEEYLRTRPNDKADWFCEFNALGNVALKAHPHEYTAVEQFSDAVTPKNYLQQFWSHGPLDKPQNIWVNGAAAKVVPVEMMKGIMV